jgi:hypothetical protein
VEAGPGHPQGRCWRRDSRPAAETDPGQDLGGAEAGRPGLAKGTGTGEAVPGLQPQGLEAGDAEQGDADARQFGRTVGEVVDRSKVGGHGRSREVCQGDGGQGARANLAVSEVGWTSISI